MSWKSTVITAFASQLLSSQGQTVSSIRGVFVEGERIFPDSAIFDLAHIQVAIQDQSLIKDCYLVDFQGGE
jgi:hypothetical protein